MIDLHNHIINQSEIDDINWQNILETARLAVGEGIEHLVWTPEIYTVEDLERLSEFQKLVDKLQAEIDVSGYPLKVSLGADLHLSYVNEPMCRYLKECINTNYLIVSFNPYVKPSNIHEFIISILSQNLVPIIAHPEQYVWLNEEFKLIYDLIELGAWFQVTSDSLLGMLGLQAKTWANRLIEEGLVHLVASESHSLDYKPPMLGEAKLQVDNKLGPKEADNMFHNRAYALINNQGLDSVSLPPGILAYWDRREITA